MVELTDLQFMAPSPAAFPSNSGLASPFSDHTGIRLKTRRKGSEDGRLDRQIVLS